MFGFEIILGFIIILKPTPSGMGVSTDGKGDAVLIKSLEADGEIISVSIWNRVLKTSLCSTVSVFNPDSITGTILI